MSTNDSLVYYLLSYFVLRIWAPLQRSNADYCLFGNLLLLFSFINAYLLWTRCNFDPFFLITRFNTVASNFVAGPDESRYDNVACGSAPPFSAPFTQNALSSVSSVFNPARLIAVMLCGMGLFLDNIMRFVTVFYKK
jgi:hypothetical protein